MYTEKDILARLQNGEDAQTIADEMINILNKANQAYTDQQNNIQKKKEFETILNRLGDWLGKYYAENEADAAKMKADVAAIDVDEIIKGLDSILALTKDVNSLVVKTKARTIPVVKKVEKTADEAIADFLNKMGW